MEKTFFGLFICFIILSIGIYCSDKLKNDTFPTIKLEIQKDFMTGRVCMGTPPQCFDSTIDITSVYSWLPGNVYKTQSPVLFYPKQSSSYETKGKERYIVYPGGEMISGILSKDIFSIEGKSALKINFVVGDMCEDYLWYQGLIALSFQVEQNEIELSLLDQLFLNQQITHRVFHIKYEKEIDAQLTFGLIPREIIDNKQYYGNCQALIRDRFNPEQVNNGWHCTIEGFFFGTRYSKDVVHGITDTRVIFDINKMNTIVPMSFLLYLEKHYFNSLISEGKCRFGLKNALYTITCVKNDYELKHINFILGEWAIQLSLRDLLSYDQFAHEYEFILKGKLANNLFTFGDSLLRKYQMVFDKDNKEIGFYSKTNVLYVGNSTFPINQDIIFSQLTQDIVPVKDKKMNWSWIKTKNFLTLSVAFGVIAICFACLVLFRHYRRKATRDNSFYQAINDKGPIMHLIK